MFKEDFVWGVASSAYQVEGRDPEDGAGTCIWDIFADDGRVFQNQDAYTTCDMIHHYKEDFAMMRLLGIKAYRFSISWSRIMPNGTGEVNQKGITLYRDMILEMKKNGIEPYITMYHWELPQAVQERGGFLNAEIAEWFGEYARVVAENFSDICSRFITFNEPQCTINLGLVTGAHAPGLKLSAKETFLAAHNLLRAHGKAVLALRKYAKQEIEIGFAPTCGVAYPATDSPEDIEAAKQVYFGFEQPLDNWAWNVSWFSDPVVFGSYPEEGLKKYKEYLPEITEEDMALIHQPIDFLGQNIYNGYQVKAGVDGKPEYVDRPVGYTRTATGWPVTPDAFYWGARFLYEKYQLPFYITENGMSCHDTISPDGQVHDPDRIAFLDSYIGALQRAADDGADIRGYFLWSYIDNFEWSEGYSQRFGIVYVDYPTQKRIVKDSAYWYRKVMETNGAVLTVNQKERQILFMEPVFKHNIWGGEKLSKEYGYPVSGTDIGECWGIAAHENGDALIREGVYAGMHLSEVWKKYPELFGRGEDSREDEKFPLLVKIIDAKSDLSIQVHPDDAYAGENENGSLGKTECWYILDCEENASLVIGHNATTREELCQMIDQGRWSELIREVPVKKGDFIQINPGTVHAIKGGIVLLETQQNSDITYRVYDYDRLSDGKPRELHIEQSKEVITVPAASVEDMVIHDTEELKDVVSTEENPGHSVKLLEDCSYYRVYRFNVNGRTAFIQNKPFLLMSVVEGDGLINGHYIKKGDHFILPADFGIVRISGCLKLIASTTSCGNCEENVEIK